MNEKPFDRLDATVDLPDTDATLEVAEKRQRELLAIYERFLDELGSPDLSVQLEKEIWLSKS